MRFFLAALAALSLVTTAHAQEARTLDSFETLSAWTADASTDVSSRVSPAAGHDGQAMRLDYDFNGRSGYAFAARAIDLQVPENYEISFWLRGETQPNTLEIKFVDASGENVHWRRVEKFAAPDGWTRYVIKKRQIIWAWGPEPDRTFRGSARIEFVITAGEGGKGFIEVDELELRQLPPEPSVPPRPLAEATDVDGLNVAARAVDGDPATAWRTKRGYLQTLTLDLGYEREFGGVTLRWAERLGATDYELLASSDGREWRTLAAVQGGDGGVDWLRTPEASARWLRLNLKASQATGGVVGQMGAGQRLNQAGVDAYALNELEIEPLSFGESPTSFIRAVAAESRRGLYPRGFHGEQPYWTLVGVDGGGESGLMGEDGAIELRRGGPSIEPFVIDHGRLVTWADVEIEQSLKDGYLPIPTVTWTADDWTLATTAFAEGLPDSAALWGRYVLTNSSPHERTLTLALAARPYQVNGPSQFLAIPGGVGPIEQFDWNGAEMVLNDSVRVSALNMPDAIAAASFQAGADPQALLAEASRRRNALERQVESDAEGLTSGALLYDMTLKPGESRTIGFFAKLTGESLDLEPTGYAAEALAHAEDIVATEWRGKLNRFDMTLPPEAQRIEDVMKSSLAHMLMSRQGPILQPGTRSYNRSWIRDGAMMAEGLNRVGHADLSADYLEWFAPYVFDNGKVPCCVDARGSDPVPENDSHGEFIFLAAETYRYTRDEAALRAVWPQVQKAIAYMDELRASTRTAEFQTADQRHLFGLLPPTISHEGYSDKIAYSYWDDFWGLLGYRDAVYLAGVLGDADAKTRFEAAEAQFSADIMASITATARVHGIDWIAGAADRGDFDATSTTIGLSPGGLIDELPRDLLENTFEKYWTNFQDRAANRIAWKDYTPYELRNVGALLRLGHPELAMEALDFFFSDMRPRAWNGWAEVVGRHLREPRFIGDMPHAWISSDYIRSALDLFAYDRDGALVLASGVPHAWFDTAEGVGVRFLKTPYGSLSYLMKRDETGDLHVTIPEGGAQPPGGFLLVWPESEPLPSVTRVNDRVWNWEGRELRLPVSTTEVVLER